MYVSFLYFLKRLVFVKASESFFRIYVENMKAGEWHSLMKGKAVQPPLVSGASGAAGKGSALMLARTPAGYALKAAGTINQASRQANAEM